MTLYDLLTEGSAALLQAGDTDGENDAKLLLFEVFHLDLVHFLMDRLRPLSESDAETQEKMQTYRARKEEVVSAEDTVVITAGVPIGQSGTTNLIKAQVVGEKI